MELFAEIMIDSHLLFPQKALYLLGFEYVSVFIDFFIVSARTNLHKGVVLINVKQSEGIVRTFE